MNLQIFNPLHWNKSFLFSILAAFLVIWILFIDTYSLYTRFDLHQKKEDLIERTESMKQEAEILEKKIRNLQNDTGLLEKIAREEYGMRKPGETVYRIQKK